MHLSSSSKYTGSVSASTPIIFSFSIPCTRAVCLPVPPSSFLSPFLVRGQCVRQYPHHLYSSISCTRAVCPPVPSSSLLLHFLYTGSVSASTLIIFTPPFLVHGQCVRQYPHHLYSSIPCTRAVCPSVPSSSFLLHTQAQQASTSAPSRGSQPGRETDVKESQWFPPSCEEQQVHSQDLAGWLGVQLGAIASATGIQTFSTVLVHNHHSSKMLDIIYVNVESF